MLGDPGYKYNIYTRKVNLEINSATGELRERE